MILLDLSSAFDIVSYTILLNALRSLGVKGQAYEWFKSYLSCHSQAVCVNGCKSNTMPLNCGVPQGSVGGPLNYLSHRSSGPQYELICIQPIRDRAYSFAYSQSTAGDSTLGIN